LELRLKFAVVLVVPDPVSGPPVIVVTGSVLSSEKDRDATVESTFPDGSLARTLNV
jgi:hypothetical protein